MEKRKRLFYLDFIRSLSIICIVVFHFNCSIISRSIGHTTILIQNFVNGDLGRIGVSLFFIISGASLMYVYQKDFYIKKYIINRIKSIYPMFWTAYAIVFMYYFYKYCSMHPFSNPISKWSFVLTIFGVDGYLSTIVPNYYILGEWFLGCIILFYFCFPILRKLNIRHPKGLAIGSIIVYFLIIEHNVFKIDIDHNIFVRMPEFLFGMYFIQYIKKIKLHQFIIAIIFSIFIFLKPLYIHQNYKTTIIGISLFIILTFVSEYIKLKNIQNLFNLISKYSYAIFLIQHIVIEQMLVKFSGINISVMETYCLFIIVCIIIVLISVVIYRISNLLVEYAQTYFGIKQKQT